jgi:predicted MFS family arabinose efflux permease
MLNKLNKSLLKPWKPVLQSRQFCWLMSGNVAMFCGFSATLLLRSLLAWKLTGDEMSLAYINLVAAGCMFFMSIFSGAIVDRLERRRLMIVGQSILLVSELFILLLLVSGHLTFGYLLISAFAVSSTFPFIMPARTAMVVEAVGRPLFGKATAMMAGGINVARMVSPALAGIIADAGGLRYGYVYLLLLHVAGLICTFKLQQNFPPQEEARGHIFGEIKDGFSYIFGHRPLALCIVFGLMPIMVVMPFQNLMVVFVEKLWDHGSSGLGIMMGAMGVGGLLGSMLMSRIKENSLVKPMVVAALLMGVFMILLSHSPWFWLGVMVTMGVYSSSVLTQSLVHTGVQLMAEEKYRGRVTTMTLMTFGMAPVGTIPLAFAIKTIGPAWGLTIVSLVMMLAVMAIWLASPAFRRIDEEARIS